MKTFDAGLARGEAAIATGFLVAMIVAASIQAIFRNLTNFELEWANQALDQLEWVDPFLQKGTLWLAFLGASLATRDHRHIAIDLLPRIAPPRVKLILRAIAGFFSAIVSFGLARAFWAAVLINAEERPSALEVFGDSGPMHLCDAPASVLQAADMSAPGGLCALRSFLGAFGVPIETSQSALQIIVPVMFVLIGIRLLGNVAGSVMELLSPEEEKEEDRVREVGTETEPDADRDDEDRDEDAPASDDDGPSDDGDPSDDDDDPSDDGDDRKGA